MLDFTVDTQKCTQCGECVRDCLYGIIGMDEHPFIHADKAEKCIGCQHCMAVCKPGALSIMGKDPARSATVKTDLPTPEQMEALIASRRSVRRYKREGVDPALIRRMLEAAVQAPTAINQQMVHLTVVDTPEAMDRLRKKTNAAAFKTIREGRLPAGYERIADFLVGATEEDDIIFRNAPHLLVASAPPTSVAPMADCHIAMSYFELVAASHGIGTVWDGIAKAMMTAVTPECRDLLGIPADHEIVCVMAFGRSAVKYHRAVQRTGGTIRIAAV